MLFLACSSLFLIRKIKTIQIWSSSSLVYIPIWLLPAILISFHLQKLSLKSAEFCLRLVLSKLPLSLCSPSDCGKGLSLGNDDGSGYVPWGQRVKVDKQRVVNAESKFGFQWAKHIPMYRGGPSYRDCGDARHRQCVHATLSVSLLHNFSSTLNFQKQALDLTGPRILKELRQCWFCAFHRD